MASQNKSIPPAPLASSKEQGWKYGHISLALECLSGAAKWSKRFTQRTAWQLATFTSPRHGYHNISHFGNTLRQSSKIKKAQQGHQRAVLYWGLYLFKGLALSLLLAMWFLLSVPAEPSSTCTYPPASDMASSYANAVSKALSNWLNSLGFTCLYGNCAWDSYIPIYLHSNSADRTVNGMRIPSPPSLSRGDLNAARPPLQGAITSPPWANHSNALWCTIGHKDT